MKHCVIALHFQSNYISVLSHYDEKMDIGNILNRNHKSMDAAEELISMGDISHFDESGASHFYGDKGYTWGQAKPIVHESPKALVEYSLSVKATHLLCFEDGQWQEIPLSTDDDCIRSSEYAA